MKTITINLKDIKPGKSTFQVSSTAEELELTDIEFKVIGDIQTEINIYRNRNNYEMEITSKFKMLLFCSRCLNEFEKEFVENDHFYLKEGFEKTDEETTFSDEDAYTIFFNDDIIDISPLVREQVILSIPIKPLCSDSCKVPEYNKEEQIDPRWQKLLDLFKK
ncbi:MAG: DUF177 domain-containing protein [candidate division WOR-3 bacterium]